MLKPQDIVIVMKIMVKGQSHWSQGSLAMELGMSASEVNGGIKRAVVSALLHKREKKVIPVKSAIEEFLVHGLKYVFPPERGEPTRGIPTAYASPVFKGKVFDSEKFAPVWPDAEGSVRGYELKPLYKCVPFAIKQDPVLYDYMAIIDALRSGRTREVKFAKELLHKALQAA
jgi:hypothetical protein